MSWKLLAWVLLESDSNQRDLFPNESWRGLHELPVQLKDSYLQTFLNMTLFFNGAINCNSWRCTLRYKLLCMLIRHIGFFFQWWKQAYLILIEVLNCLQMQGWTGQRDKVVVGLWFPWLLFALVVTNDISGVLPVAFAFVCMLKMVVYGVIVSPFCLALIGVLEFNGRWRVCAFNCWMSHKMILGQCFQMNGQKMLYLS